MRILITNDDGVHAKGISVLKKIASKLSDDIWVCAPEAEQSASSRSVSLHNPVRIKQYGEKTFSVSGTPTDSVIIALSELLDKHKPDLLLSGVNRGQNLAEDVSFSGTIAAALQGMQMGIPSIALSLARGFQGEKSLPWDTAEMHGSKLILDLYKHGWCSRSILSINFPDVPAKDVKGIKITKQGTRDFQMSGVEKRSYPRGGDYYWLTYGAGRSNPPEGTDLRAIYDGYISITPIHTNLTNTSEIKVLKKKFLNSK